MKPARTILIGCLLLLIPVEVSAQSLYPLFYKETEETQSLVYPNQQVVDYVIEEMKSWHDEGIQITETDIKAAIDGGTDAGGILCKDKVTMAGDPIVFANGGANEENSCDSLQQDILNLLNAEKEATQLGADLLTIADGSELAISDEPQRPIDMGRHALNLHRIWTGTGSPIVPWDGSANTELNNLEGVLAGLSPLDLDKAMLRFRHGYYRDQHEADPQFASIATAVGDKLKALGDKLGTVDDPQQSGEFSVPKFTSVENVAVWARKDDIGLLWIYPSHLARLTIKRAGRYPKMYPDGELLAYPFSYSGSTPLSAPYNTPLCSRTAARYGYLCRFMPTPDEDCQEPSDDGISLVQCGQDTLQSSVGPYACTGLDALFDDNGTPLVDPSDPGKINPALQTANLPEICTPDTRILYQDDIRSHACYVSHCLIQSMNKHTLIPGRNPVLIDESVAPYASCLRRDPELGRYMQVPYDVPYMFPAYINPELVMDFEREYCVKNGNVPHPLAGFCAYRATRRSRSPDYMSLFQGLATTTDGNDVSWNQGAFNAAAAAIGDRAAAEQMATVQRKVFGGIAAFVQQIADLFLELKNASLTKTPCPWTGPFRPS